MSNNIQWTAIENSGSQLKGQNKHILLVAYKPGMGGINEVCAVCPMYNLKDMDLSGRVSVLELGWSAVTWVWDPLYVFGLIKSANKSSCITDAASQMNDPFLFQASRTAQLEAIFSLRREILTGVMCKGLIGQVTGPALTLASAGIVELMKVGGGAAAFIIKMGFEAAIQKALIYSVKH